MRLKKILDGVDVLDIKNFKNYSITSITHVSQDVVKGGLFICIKGGTFDGNDYIEDAISRGARCIVTDSYGTGNYNNICFVVVKDIRKAMSVIAKNFYNRCVDLLDVIAIVGTAGKTTTSLLIGQILEYVDNNIGVIGTNGVFIKGIRQENKFTTPDPIELHYIFFQMQMLGVKTVVMEVSAQAIYYSKIYGIKFKYAVFTNINREHLDFFGSYENYVKTKMSFFTSDYVGTAIINTDDFYGRELAYKCSIPVVSYGINDPANSFAMDIDLGFDYTAFIANVLDEVVNVRTPFVGRYNVYNLIGAMTVAKLIVGGGINLNKVVDNLKPIDGRYNVYYKGYKKIIIDFAHTPNSIEELLSHIKTTTNSKIISLFGCVGYSDKDKRQKMGEVVARYSDYIIITTDNIGMANFGEVAEDIILGVGTGKYVCIEDRKTAIDYGYSIMNDGDILVLIGKGAENFQTIGVNRVPYSDKDCVMEIINRKD